METIEKAVEVTNDLIEINNDRAAGFEKAARELDTSDNDLRTLFESSSSESRQFSNELALAANRFSANNVESDHSATGALHRAWIDVKATFTGHNRESILAECERGEDAIKKAYRDALSEGNLPEDLATIIARQQESIIASHDRIKALRDSAS
jgi:uncharacterized protein (TIGR02284 family)